MAELTQEELNGLSPRARKAHGQSNDMIQEIVNNEKSSRGCQECGYNKSPFALDFHHVNKKTKNVSYWFKSSYTQLKKIKKEWKKCIVLCANCHRIEHHGLGNATKN